MKKVTVATVQWSRFTAVCFIRLLQPVLQDFPSSFCVPIRRNLSDVLLWFESYLYTYLFTYFMEKSPSWEANSSWLVNKFPAFYRTWRFVTAFTSARHLSLSWARSIQSMPANPTSWRSILILSSHLCLGLPSGLFPSGFPNKTPYKPLLSPICATCPTHLILLDLITQIIFDEEYRSLSSSLCSFLHCRVTSSFLGPNIPSALRSQMSSAAFLPQCERPSFTPIIAY